MGSQPTNPGTEVGSPDDKVWSLFVPLPCPSPTPQFMPFRQSRPWQTGAHTILAASSIDGINPTAPATGVTGSPLPWALPPGLQRHPVPSRHLCPHGRPCPGLGCGGHSMDAFGGTNDEGREGNRIGRRSLEPRPRQELRLVVGRLILGRRTGAGRPSALLPPPPPLPAGEGLGSLETHDASAQVRESGKPMCTELCELLSFLFYETPAYCSLEGWRQKNSKLKSCHPTCSGR